jgi:hypothetical protein
MTLPFPIQFASNGPQWAQGFDAWYDYTKPQGSQLLAFPPATDTHSATVYAQSSSGVWQAIPANVPSRTDLGLQTVPTRTNLLLWSQDIADASWSIAVGPPTITVNNTTAPDGTLTADKWSRTTTAATYTGQAVGGKAAVAIQYTLSGFVKADTARYAAIRLQGTYPARVDAIFDLQTGTVSSAVATASFSGAAATITPAAFGFFRVTITSTSDATPVLPVFLSFNNNGTQVDGVDSSSTSSGWVWQMQLEAAAFASPPIVTTSSSATVNGNQQVVDLTGRLSAGVGVIFQFNPLDITATFKCPLTFNNGTGNNLMLTYMTVGGGTVLSQIYNGGINQGNVNWPGANATGVQTWVWVAGPDYHRAQKIGFAASSTDTTVSWPTLTRMSIGGTGYTAGDNMYQLTRRIGLKFGTANDAMFNELVSKATLLAAVS